MTLIVILLILIFLGLPIGMCFGLAGILYLTGTGLQCRKPYGSGLLRRH